MFKELFENTLKKLDNTNESVIAALTVANLRYIKDMNSRKDEDDEYYQDVIDFGEYFFDNYYEKVEEELLTCFSELPFILDFYAQISNAAIEAAILDDIGTETNKKAKFNIEKLKKEIIDILPEFESILIKNCGKYVLDGSDIEYDKDYVIDGIEDLDEEDLEKFLMIAIHSKESNFLISGADGSDRCVIYGIGFNNNGWYSIPTKTLSQTVDNDDFMIYGYDACEFREIQRKY